jgi:hypothetical protein
MVIIMKKTTSIILCAILAFSILVGCASADYAPAGSTNMFAAMAPPAPQADAPLADTGMSWDVEYSDDSAYRTMAEESGRDMYAYSGGGESAAMGDGGLMPVVAPVTEGMSEKIIYSVYAEIETLKFNETLDMINSLMLSHNAFVESSSVSGVNHMSRVYGWNDLRSAFFSLRVPREHLNAMTASLDNLGNVVHRNSNATNITSQFFDTQSRLNSLNVREERLLDMISKAEDIADLIVIEQHLGDIRYQIESLTTTINNWQTQVDYSYLTLSIREVEEYTEFTPPHRSYWERTGDGFMSTIRNIGRFFMNLFMWLIVSAPVLIILAAIVLTILLIVKRKIRAFRKKQIAIPVNPIAPHAPPEIIPAETESE